MPGWVAIVNPRSRGGESPASLARLLARLRPAVQDVFVSEWAGHVGLLVHQAHDADGIFVCGGDGTLFEVLQACDRDRQRIGLWPHGRGNSLAKDLGLRDEAAALGSIARGVDRSIDLLDVTLRHADGQQWRGVSASNIALGYPADVAQAATRYRWLGSHSYTAAAAITRPRSVDVEMTIDGTAQPTVAAITGLVVSNSRYVGPFLGFPAADLHDGVAHAMVLRGGRMRQALQNVSTMTGLGFDRSAPIHDLRAMRAVGAQPLLLMIDGELFDDVREITIEVLPDAVTFRVPAAARG